MIKSGTSIILDKGLVSLLADFCPTIEFLEMLSTQELILCLTVVTLKFGFNTVLYGHWPVNTF